MADPTSPSPTPERTSRIPYPKTRPAGRPDRRSMAVFQYKHRRSLSQAQAPSRLASASCSNAAAFQPAGNVPPSAIRHSPIRRDPVQSQESSPSLRAGKGSVRPDHFRGSACARVDNRGPLVDPARDHRFVCRVVCSCKREQSARPGPVPPTILEEGSEDLRVEVSVRFIGTLRERTEEQIVYDWFDAHVESNERLAPIICDEQRLDATSQRLPRRIGLPQRTSRRDHFGSHPGDLGQTVSDPLNPADLVTALE